MPTPTGLGDPGLTADGLSYFACKLAAGWGNGGLDPSRLTPLQQDFCGLHDAPPPPLPGWFNAQDITETSEETLYAEPRDNKRLSVDSDLLRILEEIR
jgi:hypothetical protein